ncbi:MAG: helix-turn-helix transcriptional regulator [Oligoflexales bacterium]|nr:helix-turn-helix transcriptional regulator [Oligoflexales bacterium]
MDKKRQSKLQDKKILQKKLSFFLRNHREKNNLSSKEMAYNLGYDPSRYCKIESESLPYDRFINSIGLLKTFANLEGMSLSEFALFLDGESMSYQEQSYRKWEHKILNTFRKIKMNTRRDFLNLLGKMDKREKEILESCLNIFIKIKKGRIDDETISSLLLIIGKISNESKA